MEIIFTITDNNPNYPPDINPKLATNAYLGLLIDDPNPNTPNTSDLLIQISREFALAIQDYSDTDSTPSKWPDPNNPGVTYYGMERLPFIREVYIQAEYENLDEKLTNGSSGSDGKFETYRFFNGSGAMAIELGNPFEQDVSVDNNIRVVVIQNGVEGSTASIITPSTITSHETLIVYSVQDPTKFAPNGGSKTDVHLALDLDNIPAPTPPNELLNAPLTFADRSDVTVGLQVLVAGTWVTYDRLTVGGFQLKLEGELPYSTPAEIAALPTVETPVYGQGSMYRPCTDSFGNTPSVHYLSNFNKGLNGAMIEPPTTTYDPNKHNFGLDNKGATGDPRLNDFQLPLANRQFLSVAELGWIHMFGFFRDPNVLTVGDFPQRLTTGIGLDQTNDSRRWNLHFRTLALPFDDVVVVPDLSPSGISHAAMVMDQFTTLSPLFDREDNDNDGDDDNDEEQFVPGTININTVPLHIATLAAPLPESIDDIQSLMEVIATYRDDNSESNRRDMTNTPNNAIPVRTNPGIASIGELMFINPLINAVPLLTTQLGHDIDNDAYQIQRYGNNTVADVSEFDLYPLPERQPPIALVPPTYDPVDSAEEALARFQFLSQVFTTRSDIFTAYVVIHGYPANDMSDSGGIPIESIRFFAVFDRSGMTSADDKPRILGVYGLE